MQNSCYRGMKVLITGHTGFKGSWLTLWLRELGAEVIGFSLDPHTQEDFFVRTKLHDKITDLRGDINNLKGLTEIFKQYKPDFVFHLAAQPIVRLSYDSPIETFQTNALGTANVLEAIRQTKTVKGALLVTTDKVYRNDNSLWGYREIDPLGGHDPYSASKACAEIIIGSYRNSFFFSHQEKNPPRIASARAGNVIGGGDWQVDRLVPDCIRSLSIQKSIIIRNPEAIRPWQFVLEPLWGYLQLGERLITTSEKGRETKFDDAWNFGPFLDSTITVKQLVEKIINTWKSGKWCLEEKQDTMKYEAKRLTLDVTKANTLLDWYPVLSIDECITMTVDWYKFAIANPSDDLYDFSKSQIERYCSKAKEKKTKIGF